MIANIYQMNLCNLVEPAGKLNITELRQNGMKHKHSAEVFEMLYDSISAAFSNYKTYGHIDRVP